MQATVKCLLVDDLEENLLALSTLLEQPQVEILKARSGSEALELLLVHDVALALLDVRMPDMDGFQLAELMRGSERTRSIPIIFVTAGDQEQHRVFKGYEAGAVDFLHKPIDALILANKAAVFFQLYRQKLQLAQELKERTETLRLNEIFVAILGHDLRTPLNTVLTSTELLLRTSADASVRDLASRIRSGGDRMRVLIENVLDLARARLAGGIALDRAPLDLRALVESTMQEHLALAPERRIGVQVGGELHGYWDAGRLAQVLSNLIGNALQHGEAGSPVEITINGSSPQRVTLSVANRGRIAPEVLPHVFDPFGAGHRQRGRSQGLGLGLYIAQQIVDAHAGEIGVHVTDDGRTVFRVILPRGEPSPGAGALDAHDALPPARADASAGGARRILVVDDNRDSADSLAILLQMDGNQIRTAYDGLEAVEAAATFRPDVVLLDLGLPRLDGYQTALRIRQQPWGEPMVLVALTGRDQDEDRRRSLEAGFDRHVVKPVDSAVLLQLLAGISRR